MRFNLRTLLLSCAVLASFSGGWIARYQHMERKYQRANAQAQEIRDALNRADEERAVARRTYSVDESMMIIDRLEHDSRMRRLGR